MMKDNPRKHKGKITYREDPRIKQLDVWSYRCGTQREFHVAFLTENGTVAQGKFRIRERAWEKGRRLGRSSPAPKVERKGLERAARLPREAK